MERTPAKITCPELSKVYVRTRLFDKLDAVRDHQAIWITGPPGAGKTTLVAGYLARYDLPCLWYQIDEGDADIATFFYYLGLATKQAVPGKPQTLPALTPEYLQGLSTFTRRYFEALCNQIGSPFILVFDNYQQVATDAAFHEVIREGLAQLPSDCQAIIISRSLPPPAFARWQANRDMAMLGWDDLRLTNEETEGIAKLWDNHKQIDSALQQFHTRTDGWAAGLVLMLERSGEVETATPELSGATNEVMFDYFAGEIFTQTDKQTQTFLLQTALLPGITVPMAEELTGLKQAEQILSQLNRKHYFTERHLLTEPVYQYHPLFRDFLLTRAHATIEADHLTRLKQSAAQLLIASGRAEDAVVLLQETEDWHRLGQLIAQQAHGMIVQGRNNTLQAWLNSLPKAMRNDSPWLLFWLGACRLPFDPTEAREHFDKAFTFFTEQQDREGQYLSWSSIIDTFLYAWGDFRALDHWIKVFDELYIPDTAFPSTEIEARVVSGIFSALLWRQPQHADLPMWAERVKSIALHTGDQRLRVMLSNNLVLYYLWMGNFTSATVIIDTLREANKPSQNDPLTQLTWYVMEAMHAWFNASHETCLNAVDEGIKLAEASGVHLLDLYLYAQGVYSSLSLGAPEVAAELLKKMSRLTITRLMDQSLYHYLSSSAAWFDGDLQRAIEHGEVAVQLAEETGTPLPTALCQAELALVWFEHGQSEQALPLLKQAFEFGTGMHHITFMYYLYSAYFALETDKEVQGLDMLRRAMELGSQQAYVNYPRWRNDIMANLCVNALQHDIEAKYVHKLIRLRSLTPTAPPVQLENWPWAIKVSTLGRFAVQVNGEAINNSKTLRSKPLDILKAVIAQGGKGVREETITDALWPDAEADAAHHAFETALYRLRKLIGIDQAITLQDGQITLDPFYCWIDVWSLEHQLDQLQAAIKSKACGEIVHNLEIASLSLYQGPFLSDAMDQAWSLSLRERLHNRLLRTLGQLGDYSEKSGNQAHAIDCYQHVLELDPLAEEFYQRLMTSYHQLDRNAEALAVYQRCRDNLHVLLAVKPSPATEALYKKLHG